METSIASRSAVEGSYVLKEWYNDGKIFRPPQVEARMVLLSGTIAAIFVDKMDEAKQITNAQFGVYSLQAGSFSYRWDNISKFTQTPNGITVSHPPGFDGMRTFEVKQESDTVRFQSQSAEQAEFLFTPEDLKYSEGGRVLRIWDRANELHMETSIASRSAVEGSYVLKEWYNDGKIFRPPQVEARLALLNGTIAVIFVGKIDEAKQITNAQFGVYSLQADSFSYRWDNVSEFTQTPNGITVSHAPGFSGMRTFEVKQEGGTVRFQSQSAEQAEFLFTPEDLKYSEGGSVSGIWGRAI